jgi:GDPmannose 4,6-dehydratase
MDISRDWGWAPEYVEAMWLMLQQIEPTDFVIATGKTYTLENFVETAFSQVDLDWRKFVKHSDEFLRPTDLIVSRADPSKAQEILKWEAKLDMPKVIDQMLNS